MDCHRRWRLDSAALIAVLVLCGQTLRSQERHVFDSHPQVGVLQCAPPPATTTTTRAIAPSDRMPSANDLDAGAIELPRPAEHAPPLPLEIVRRVDLPEKSETPLRVGIWGDSHVAAGYIIDELTKVVEASGRRVTAHAIPSSVGRPGVRLPLRRVCKSDGWQFEAAYSAASPLFVGPSLANLRSSRTGAYLWLDFRQRPDRTVRSALLHYLPPRQRSAIGVRVDDGPEKRFALEPARTGSSTPGVMQLSASSGISTLKIRVLQGEFVMQGLTLEDVEPADISFDVFAMPSATARGWANADVRYLKQAIAPADYDAVILAYGTNEGAVERWDRATYAAMLSESLRNMRQIFPDSACLLIGPTDRGVRVPQGGKRGRIDFLYYSRIHQQIARTQADVGASFGCATWDWQRYMGGPGSVYSWAREAQPLAAFDLIHLTPPGYRRTARGLAQSLGWLKSEP